MKEIYMVLYLLLGCFSFVDKSDKLPNDDISYFHNNYFSTTTTVLPATFVRTVTVYLTYDSDCTYTRTALYS